VAREHMPDAELSIHYIDLRVMGRYEDVLAKVQADSKTRLVRGKVAKIEEAAGGAMVLEAEDTATGNRTRTEADLVVLATGMVPNARALPLPATCKLDENGFVVPDGSASGVVPAGCAVRPAEVAGCMQEATGAALKAMLIAG